MDNSSLVNKILIKFKIDAKCVAYNEVGSYYHYDIKLDASQKIKVIENILDELALALKLPKPSLNVIHEQGVVRLEFRNKNSLKTNLFDIFSNKRPTGDLICLLGKSVEGKNVWMDLAKNPHTLIAGTTGSGKSVLLHNLIANVLNYSNSKIILIDPKNIEFQSYEKIKNIMVGYTYESSIKFLKALFSIMEKRFLMLKMFPNTNFNPIVLIIDEFADLIMQDKNKEFHDLLCRLAQKSRAAKIHLILATQRPSVDVVDGLIKANFPARISCRVASQIDSRVILDEPGAQRLAGQGDALLKDNLRSMQRFQVAYTSPEEICKFFT